MTVRRGAVTPAARSASVRWARPTWAADARKDVGMGRPAVTSSHGRVGASFIFQPCSSAALRWESTAWCAWAMAGWVRTCGTAYRPRAGRTIVPLPTACRIALREWCFRNSRASANPPRRSRVSTTDMRQSLPAATHFVHAADLRVVDNPAAGAAGMPKAGARAGCPAYERACRTLLA